MEVQPHDFFHLDGDDITVSVPITFIEAVRGAIIKVPTVQGQVNLKLPPGTRSGQKFRLRGQGGELAGGGLRVGAAGIAADHGHALG